MLKYRQTVELLEQRIRNGEYPDGRLPAVRQLAADVGVSYLTARKAVQELKENGVISHNESNRRIVIRKTGTPRPLVGVITPFWHFSDWVRSIRDVTGEFGGMVRFVSYTSNSDPVITEALNAEFDVLFVILPSDQKNARLIERLKRFGKRVVVLFQDLSEAGLRSITGVHPETVKILMNKLLEHGCRRIDVVSTGNHTSTDIALRIRVWREFLDEHRIPGSFLDPDIVPFEHPESKIRRTLLHYFASGAEPDAFFCLTPGGALGVYRACYEQNLRIGRDVSVFSFGEVELARVLTPALATVSANLGLDRMMREVIGQYLPGREPDERMLFQLQEFEIFTGESLK